MTARPRQIDEQTAILTNPAAHWPQRPWWRCAVDGQTWPCEPLRFTLLATMAVQDIGAAMATHYEFAVRELDAPAAEVHRQLLGWIRADR